MDITLMDPNMQAAVQYALGLLAGLGFLLNEILKKCGVKRKRTRQVTSVGVSVLVALVSMAASGMIDWRKAVAIALITFIVALGTHKLRNSNEAEPASE